MDVVQHQTALYRQDQPSRNTKLETVEEEACFFIDGIVLLMYTYWTNDIQGLFTVLLRSAVSSWERVDLCMWLIGICKN